MIDAKKVASAIATGTLLLNAFATTAFASDLIIAGNGADSNNTVNLSQNNSTNVVQNNNASVNNDVNSSASTGNNSASYNNGGNVHVVTGDASTTTNVSTSANLNKADINGCCNSGTNVTVADNAAYSNNTANVSNDSSTNAYQTNNASINNHVNSTSKTGNNDADFNNGGSVVVATGNASTNTSVDNMANANLLKIGGGSGAGSDGAGLSVRILGNAAFSNNTVNLDVDPSLTVVQNNNADIYNDVYSKADTGNNSADFNNGGAVVVATGDAWTKTSVDNMTNFNSADVDCGCILDTLAKVAGNAYGSNNEINANLGSDLGLFQDNCGGEHGLWLTDFLPLENGCSLNNDVYSKAKTGNNDASFNNAGVTGGDPAVVTGDASQTTDVSNSSNVNLAGNGSTLSLPGGTNVNLHLDLGDLLNLLSGLSL